MCIRYKKCIRYNFRTPKYKTFGTPVIFLYLFLYQQIQKPRSDTKIFFPFFLFRNESSREWSPKRVEVKVDDPGEKRSNWVKVDGPKPQKWTVRKGIKCKVYESGRSNTRKWTVHKEWNWTVPKCVCGQEGVKVDGPQNAWTVKKGWKWTVSIYARGRKMMNFDDFKRLDFDSSRSFISGMKEHRACSVELFCSVLFCRTHVILRMLRILRMGSGLKWKILSRIGRSKILKVDGLRKSTVLKFKSGRIKVDGLKESKWTVQKAKNGRSKEMKLDGRKSKNWTV